MFRIMLGDVGIVLNSDMLRFEKSCLGQCKGQEGLI